MIQQSLFHILTNQNLRKVYFVTYSGLSRMRMHLSWGHGKQLTKQETLDGRPIRNSSQKSLAASRTVSSSDQKRNSPPSPPWYSRKHRVGQFGGSTSEWQSRCRTQVRDTRNRMPGPSWPLCSTCGRHIHPQCPGKLVQEHSQQKSCTIWETDLARSEKW